MLRLLPIASISDLRAGLAALRGHFLLAGHRVLDDSLLLRVGKIGRIVIEGRI